jgi:hypothetical protein
LAAFYGKFHVVLLALLSAAAITSAAASPLEEGRKSLREDQLQKALAHYSPINPAAPEYVEKIEDLTRFHLLRGEGVEAWRVLQVGRRVRVARPEWNDLERLAVYRAGACPLALSSENKAHAHLLNAATYRYLTFQKSEEEREEDVASLGPGLVPYLRDIPRTELIRGQGCRVAKQLTPDKRAQRKAELKEILDFLDLGEKVGTPLADVLLKLRALEIAKDEPKVVEKLRASLPSPALAPWRELPDPERQWLFVNAFEGHHLEEISKERRAEAQAIALKILEADDAAPFWLAAVELDSLKANARADLLSKVEKKGGTYEGRGWILFELARTRYQLGQMNESLTLLRRLLVENEESASEKIEEASVQLAASIFAEHRLDQKALGALDAALPSRLWRSLLTQAMMRAALSGRSAELAALEKIAERRNSRLDVELLRPLARRDLRKFKIVLNSMNFDFARMLAAYLIEFPKTRGLAPFANATAERLQRMGGGAEDEKKDLIQILSSSESDWMKGAVSVRQGVIKVGVARWPQSSLRPASFALQPPETMDRRELIFIPDTATERGWKFSTSKR